MTRSALTRGALVLPLLAALAGCADTSMGQVTGTVTYKGKPVTSGVIQFTPEKGPMAFGGLDPSGRFTLTTKVPNDGALAGTHRVCVTPYYAAAGDAPPGAPADPDPKNIPNQYRVPATTPLTADVVGGRLNEFTFELKD